ncbi:MAG: PD40 domain-containing protein [Bdellovibrionaceae bacterium]|nr:PD40 domain-containing protein [Pseudobdellovibrionaceae bacterium]
MKAALTFLFTGWIAFAASAQVNPYKSWRTLHLGHFDLIYDAENQQLAEIYAERLKALTPIYKAHWVTIPPKTVFVLNDRTDLTNGYATFLPYNLIMIFPVVPGPQDSIGEYHDWAWEISVHEYTHTLEMNQRRGVVWGLSYLFGSIMTPNALLPRWSLEGAAVDHETRFSKGGRLRSKMQAGILRSLGAAGKLDEVRQAEINEFDITTWPYGSRPYLYGSLMWSDWINSYGDHTVRDLHNNTGGRVPWLLDGAFEPVFGGRNMVQLFEETKKKMVDAAKAEVATLAATPLSPGVKVDSEMRESLSPAISPDGLKLAYVAKNASLRRSVQVLVRPQTSVLFEPSQRVAIFGKAFDQSMPSGSPIPRGSLQHGPDGDDHGGDHGPDAPPGGNITRISWHPSSNSFIFDQVLLKNRYREVSDIWSFDLVRGKAEQLTKDARAREPAYAPDGSKIAFTQIVPGRTDLSVFNVDTKEIKRVFEAPPQGRVSFPVWLDTSTLLFSLRSEGREQVLKLNIDTGVSEKVLDEWKDPQFLTVLGDRVLFTSSQNGVRNLYRTDRDFKNGRPVTHVVSHILGSTYDRWLDRYYYTEITEEAYQLKTVTEAEAQTLPAALPVVGNFWGDRYAPYTLPFSSGKAVGVEGDAVAAPAKLGAGEALKEAHKIDNQSGEATHVTVTEPTGVSLASQSEDYSPWGYLWPRFWLPFVAWDDLGVYVSALTQGSDPLGKHIYSLSAQYDSAIQRGSYLASYTNQSFYPVISITSYDQSLQMATRGQYSRVYSTSFVSYWTMENQSPYWTVGFGGGQGGNERFGQNIERTYARFATTYRNAFQYGDQISPESGWVGSLSYVPGKLKDLNRIVHVAEASGAYYFSRWLPKRHVLMLKGQARTSDEPWNVSTMDQSVANQTTSNSLIPQYLNRGFSSGSLMGRNILGINAEYRLPFGRLDKGFDGYPFYAHRWHGAIVADGTFVDGLIYDEKSTPMTYRRSEGTGYWSAGFETRFDVNVGYHFPIQFGFGIYMPFANPYTESVPRMGGFLIL